jgi:transposase InsO family protein
MRQFIVGAPLERIAIDVLGPLPVSDRGNKYILIAADYFTKWVEAYPLENQRAEVVAEVLVKEFVSRFGVPMQLHSDQGRNFESAVFSGVCKLLGVDKTRTTALHPESDGMVERFNRTLENQLAIFVEHHQKDWDDHIPLLMMSYRSAVHESTKQTPAKLMFGRELNLPIDLLFGRPPNERVESIDDYVEALEKRLENVYEFARIRTRIASDRMKKRYDVCASDEVFKVGELVWLYNPRRRKGLSPKLMCDWEGPCVIVKQINELLYRVRKSNRDKPRIIHRNRLWRYATEN